MKNKLFWPIIIVAIVIIAESVLLLSNNQSKKNNIANIENIITPVEEVKVEDVVSFVWLEDTKNPTLAMVAEKEVSIDAIDLYIAYKNVNVSLVKNLGDLPKPSFSKISEEKSLIVMNYLISNADGFKMLPGQIVKIAEIQKTSNSTEASEFSIDAKTQVVENGSAKVLPFNSKSLIINSTL